MTSQTGGHVASSLGAVEIILAVHSMIDSPHDKFVFDVGHQAYAHKLVTGIVIGKTWLRLPILLALNLRICGAATRSSAFVISVLPLWSAMRLSQRWCGCIYRATRRIVERASSCL